MGFHLCTVVALSNLLVLSLLFGATTDVVRYDVYWPHVTTEY